MLVVVVQEEGLSESVYTGGGSVQLSQGGGPRGVGGESVRLRWPAIAAAGDVQAACCLLAIITIRRRREGEEVGGALLCVRIGGGGAAPPQLRQHRLQPPLHVCRRLMMCLRLRLRLHPMIYYTYCTQVLRVVRRGAGRLLLLRLQGRPSAAAAPAGPPEILEMACLP